MLYTVEQKIHTLALNAVISDQKTGFRVENINFVPLELHVTHDFWLARTQVDAVNFQQAFLNFTTAMLKVVTRIGLISQCYIDSVLQPYLIVKQGQDVALFRHIKDTEPVGLMFMEQHVNALNALIKNTDIPQEFYSYWCDVVNATGYTPKLVLIFCALEALGRTAGKKDWQKLNAILGKQLCDEIFAPNTGLRHRLTHGEYFVESDSKKNYVYIIHSKIIEYFNRSVLGDQLLQQNVVAPQRHPFLNKEQIRLFLKPSAPDARLDLREVLGDFEQNGINQLQRYKPIIDPTLEATY